MAKKIKYDDIPEIDLDETLNSIAETEIQTNENPAKELFGEKLVKARTDLSSAQISRISRVYYLSKILNMPDLADLMNEFITLRISKDRMSRKEFVEGLKAKLDNAIMSNSLNNVRQQFGK